MTMIRRAGTGLSLILGGTALLAMTFPWGQTHAQELKGACTVGQRVTDRENKTGIVTYIDGAQCRVDLSDGTKSTYLFWMLHPAGAPRIDVKTIAAVKPGHYTCSAISSDHLMYIGMDINIRNGSQYTDINGAGGSYQYDAASQLITFASGTFQGAFGKYLEAGKIGLSNKPTTFFGTVCDIN